MSLTRIRTMLAVGLVAAVVSAIVVELATGRLWQHVNVPWTVPLMLAAAAVAIVLAAWPVRQYVKGKRRVIDPLRAANILTLAKACALGGAALAGAYLGVALVATGALHSPLAWQRLWQDLAACVAAVVLAAAGRVAEWFCRLPPEDPAADQAGAPQPDSSPA
ncbi:MAG: DUF3180 family protein [Bifidobacteriaceae bacterium]|jgi:hypothetical protein|nr:DUF3180 family protein [Bifidobacteriaceae bacterium]